MMRHVDRLDLFIRTDLREHQREHGFMWADHVMTLTDLERSPYEVIYNNMRAYCSYFPELNELLQKYKEEKENGYMFTRGSKI